MSIGTANRLAMTAVGLVIASSVNAQPNVVPPESPFTGATEPGAPPEAMALVVDKVTTFDEAPPVELTRASPQAAVVPAARVPHTASSWPLVALAGALALAGGVGLTLQSDSELTVGRRRI
jgi:hypothetical protein